MADRVPAVIRFGGTLQHSLFPELLHVLSDEGLTVLEDDEDFSVETIPIDGPVLFSEEEVAWGCFRRLEEFCRKHGLSYSRWSGSAPGSFPAERVIFTGTGEVTSYSANDDDGIVMTHEAAKALGSFEAIDAYFIEAAFTVPPLQLLHEERAQG